MVHKRVEREDADAAIAPAYTQRLDLEPIPKFEMPSARLGARGRVPADPRRAPARRQLPAEPRHLRHHLDGARGRAS